jgi:hypothetical protein
LPIAPLPLVNGVAKQRNQFLQFFFRYLRVSLFRRFHKISFRFDTGLYELMKTRQHALLALELFFVAVAACGVTPSSGPLGHALIQVRSQKRLANLGHQRSSEARQSRGRHPTG